MEEKNQDNNKLVEQQQNENEKQTTKSKWKEIPRRGLERQVVLLLLRGVCGHIGNVAVRCSIGGYIGSLLFLADVQEVDVLGMNSQLCVRCAVLALPLVNVHVTLNGQDASLGEILHQLQMCRVAALHSYK